MAVVDDNAVQVSGALAGSLYDDAFSLESASTTLSYPTWESEGRLPPTGSDFPAGFLGLEPTSKPLRIAAWGRFRYFVESAHRGR
jgi:hypothetical protein